MTAHGSRVGDLAPRRAGGGAVTLVAAALVAALAPVSPAAVERLYSTGVYPVIQPSLTAVSNLVPFALFDILIVAALSLWITRTVIDCLRISRLGVGHVIGRFAGRTVLGVAALYLLFVLVWGLNYRRVPLRDKLQFDAQAVTLDAARELVSTAVARVNSLYDTARSGGWPSDEPADAALMAAFERAQRTLGATLVAEPARPKRSLFDLYFRRAAVSGMTDPYFLETLVASDLLPFERPFVIAHEWSHLAGFADEGDANFVGWLTCLRAGPSAQYSGWLFLYSEIAESLPAAEQTDLAARLAHGPRADLRAIAARVARNVSPRVSSASRSVYDRYLKANRIEAGAASYGDVVKLTLGTRFGPNWTPLLNSPDTPENPAR